MRKINKPALAAAVAFLVCLTTVRDSGLRGRLQRCQILINDVEKSFELKYANRASTKSFY